MDRRPHRNRDHPSIRIDSVIVDAIRRLARRRGMSCAAVIREALIAYLFASPDLE
jgi:predicted transcriptional regulator